jgi:hypothetical protein
VHAAEHAESCEPHPGKPCTAGTFRCTSVLEDCEYPERREYCEALGIPGHHPGDAASHACAPAKPTLSHAVCCMLRRIGSQSHLASVLIRWSARRLYVPEPPKKLSANGSAIRCVRAPIDCCRRNCISPCQAQPSHHSIESRRAQQQQRAGSSLNKLQHCRGPTKVLTSDWPRWRCGPVPSEFERPIGSWRYGPDPPPMSSTRSRPSEGPASDEGLLCGTDNRHEGTDRQKKYARTPTMGYRFQPRRRCGRGEPSPGADVAAGEPSPSADVACLQRAPGSARVCILNPLRLSVPLCGV